jgi:hypothetical protein
VASKTLEDLTTDLDNLTADLVSESKYQPFVPRLFRAKKATWIPVKELCATLAGAAAALKTIEKRVESDLVVTWLDYPQVDGAVGYALVLFFLEDWYWSKAAWFNCNTLPRLAARNPRQVKARR